MQFTLLSTKAPWIQAFNGIYNIFTTNKRHWIVMLSVNITSIRMRLKLVRNSYWVWIETHNSTAEFHCFSVHLCDSEASIENAVFLVFFSVVANVLSKQQSVFIENSKQKEIQRSTRHRPNERKKQKKMAIKLWQWQRRL